MIEEIRQYVIDRSEAYRRESEDHYDFWNEHIRYVYQEAVRLAQIYHADETVVMLGALLHDIALIEKAGDRKDHHLNGKILGSGILDRFSCPEEIKARVLGCVLHHRSAKNAENIEELCVCDADILAHFDNIPMLFNSAFNGHGVQLSDAREWMKRSFEKDYQDLSDRTRELFSARYHQIMDIVTGERLPANRSPAEGKWAHDDHEDFWNALDELVSTSEIVIDRPKGSAHPRFPDFICRVDYGYLKDTSSMDGAGIDVWVGSGGKTVDAVMCIVDLMKRDSEIKILIGCTEEEKMEVYRTHNETQYMKGVLIRRPVPV